MLVTQDPNQSSPAKICCDAHTAPMNGMVGCEPLRLREHMRRRKHNLPISFAFDLARLGFEAWMVIGLRTAKLAMGGPAAMLEAQRMVAEKTAAMAEGQAAAGMAV